MWYDEEEGREEELQDNGNKTTGKRGGGTANYGETRTTGRLKRNRTGLRVRKKVTLTRKVVHIEL